MDNPEKVATLGTQNEGKKTQHTMSWTPLSANNHK